MKKIFVLLLALCLAAAGFAVTGCGDDTAKARSYMEKGDEQFVKTWSEWEAWGKLIEPLVRAATSGDASKLTDETVSALGENLNSMLEDFRKAKSHYEKILDLKGAEDYKAFAEKMIQTIDSVLAAVEAGRAIDEKLKPAIKDYQESKDASALVGELVTLADEFVDLGKSSIKAGAAYRDARRIKEENNL